MPKLKDLKELYSRLFMSFFTRGDSVKKDYLDGMQVKTTYDMVVTRIGYKSIINLYSFPLEYKYDIESILFERCFEQCPNVKLFFCDYNEPVKVKSKDQKLLEDFTRAARTYRKYRNVFESFNPEERETGKIIYEKGKPVRVSERYIEDLKIAYESLKYAINHTGKFFLNFKTVEVTSTVQKDMERCLDIITSILVRSKIEYKIVTGELGEYLRNLSFTGYKRNKDLNLTGQIMSDENLASESCFGEVGAEDSLGICIGVEVDSKCPTFVNFTEAPTGQVIAIMAETGGGKTSQTISQLQWYLNQIDKFVSVMDYKGTEYTPMLNIYPEGREVRLDKYYVNFLDFSGLDMDVPQDEKKFYYLDAVDGTCRLFEAMVSLQDREGNMQDLDMLIRQAVEKILGREGIVKEDETTFDLSSGVTYEMVLDQLQSMIGESCFSESQRAVLEIACPRIEEYISPIGSKHFMFENKLNYKELLDTRLLIYNFNKNQNSADFTVEDNIRFSYMQFINNKRTVKIKKKGMFNIIVDEELQRSGDGQILREVNHDTTGGRSNNKIMYLLFNSLNFLKKNSSDARAIADNITSFMIGKVSPTTARDLSNMFAIDELKPYLDRIVDDPIKYNHCFACKMNTGKRIVKGMVRAEIPDEIEGSSLYQTRTVTES